jgi:hypothetical protein
VLAELRQYKQGEKNSRVLSVVVVFALIFGAIAVGVFGYMMYQEMVVKKRADESTNPITTTEMDATVDFVGTRIDVQPNTDSDSDRRNVEWETARLAEGASIA